MTTSDFEGLSESLVRSETSSFAPIRTTADLLPAEQELLKLIRNNKYGRIEGLQVLSGQPVIDQGVKIVKSIKLERGCHPALPDPRGDFVLKQPVVELFLAIRSMSTGFLRTLEFRAGLPVHLEIEVRPGNV